MAQRLVQFRLQVWYLDGKKDASFFFRSTRSKVHYKVRDLLTTVYFKGGISHYILYQI
jgi:hypothetical protein